MNERISLKKDHGMLWYFLITYPWGKGKGWLCLVTLSKETPWSFEMCSLEFRVPSRLMADSFLKEEECLFQKRGQWTRLPDNGVKKDGGIGNE